MPDSNVRRCSIDATLLGGVTFLQVKFERNLRNYGNKLKKMDASIRSYILFEENSKFRTKLLPTSLAHSEADFRQPSQSTRSGSLDCALRPSPPSATPDAEDFMNRPSM
jgi:hypothetical protein